MKKVKLFGVLACSTMILAGCGGQTSSTTEPAKSEWTENEAAVIKDVLSYKDQSAGINYRGKLPFANGMSISSAPAEGNDNAYILAVGDKVTEAQLEAYGTLLEGDDYGFISYDEIPEDIAYLEEFEDDTIYCYYLDLNDSYFLFDRCVVVAFGQQAETKKFQMIATQVETLWAEQMLYGTNFGYYDLEAMSAEGKKQMIDIYTSYVPALTCLANGYPEPAGWDDMTEEQQEAAMAEIAANYSLLDISGYKTVSVNDTGFMYPFTYGNIYSELWAMSEYFFFSGCEATDFDDLKDDLINVKGFVQGTGDKEWLFTKEVADVGKFTLGAAYYAAGDFLESDNVIEIYYDFEAPKASA